MTRDTSQTLKKLQRTELEILNAISDLCSKHNITWWLDGGSALGARRHKGFIPWDDDIDIGMLRKDYDKFRSIAPFELPNEYSFHDARTDCSFAPLFSKVWKNGTIFATQETIDAKCPQGIFVDIFPYDYINSSPKGIISKKIRIIAQQLSYLYHSPHVKTPHKGRIGNIEKHICMVSHILIKKTLSKKMIINAFDKACTLCGSSNELLCSAYAYTSPIPVDYIIPTKNLQFENNLFPCPGKVDLYLELFYGDWTKVPDIKDRKTHLPLEVKF